MIRVLDRYVFEELLYPLLVGVGVFTFFLTIDRIYSLTDLPLPQRADLTTRHATCGPVAYFASAKTSKEAKAACRA